MSVYAGVDPGEDPARRSRPCSRSWPASATRTCAAAEIAKVKAYLAGRLELRLDETRYLASWVGTQEALHDRVMTPDEALAAIEAVTAGEVRDARRQALPRRGAAAGRGGPGRQGPRALERTLRIPGRP